MAKALIKAFPVIPDMNFCTSRKKMEKERRDQALEILEASGRRHIKHTNQKQDRQ